MVEGRQDEAGAAPSLWRRILRARAASRQRRDIVHDLYMALVDQARAPLFYRDLGVPDTPEGHIEMIGLHVILVMRRLRREGRAGAELGRALYDLMIADMDRSLREMGIGDMSIGKHIKRLGRTFMARQVALDPLLDAAASTPALHDILGRNVYEGDAGATPERIEALAGYLLAQEGFLAAADGVALVAGHIDFADPAGERR